MHHLEIIVGVPIFMLFGLQASADLVHFEGNMRHLDNVAVGRSGDAAATERWLDTSFWSPTVAGVAALLGIAVIAFGGAVMSCVRRQRRNAATVEPYPQEVPGFAVTVSVVPAAMPASVHTAELAVARSPGGRVGVGLSALPVLDVPVQRRNRSMSVWAGGVPDLAALQTWSARTQRQAPGAGPVLFPDAAVHSITKSIAHGQGGTVSLPEDGPSRSGVAESKQTGAEANMTAFMTRVKRLRMSLERHMNRSPLLDQAREALQQGDNQAGGNNASLDDTAVVLSGRSQSPFASNIARVRMQHAIAAVAGPGAPAHRRFRSASVAGTDVAMAMAVLAFQQAASPERKASNRPQLDLSSPTFRRASVHQTTLGDAAAISSPVSILAAAAGNKSPLHAVMRAMSVSSGHSHDGSLVGPAAPQPNLQRRPSLFPSPPVGGSPVAARQDSVLSRKPSLFAPVLCSAAIGNPQGMERTGSVNLSRVGSVSAATPSQPVMRSASPNSLSESTSVHSNLSENPVSHQDFPKPSTIDTESGGHKRSLPTEVGRILDVDDEDDRHSSCEVHRDRLAATTAQPTSEHSEVAVDIFDLKASLLLPTPHDTVSPPKATPERTTISRAAVTPPRNRPQSS